MTDPLLHTWNLNLGYAKRFVADIPDDTTRVYYIQEMADRAKYIEQSKKIIYHLENILAMFI